VTTEERVIAQVAEANPIPDDPESHTAQERAEAEEILRRVLDQAGMAPPRRPRPLLGIVAPVVSVLVVVLVAAVALHTGGSSTSGQGGQGSHGGNDGTHITLSAQPTPQTPRVTASAMSREIALMRRRLRAVGAGVTVRQSGASGIVVTISKARTDEQERILRLLTQPAQLRFYDWEANVLTPNGKTVASQLLTQDPRALSVSQGSSGGPGSPGPGSMSLYAAVTLAAKQPRAPASRFVSRQGSEYYLFGAPGSSACARWARVMGATETPDGHCLLAGPVDSGGAVNRADAIHELAAELPPHVTPSDGHVLVVPQGTVVLQAEQLNAAAPVPFASPIAQFFVLRDHLAMTGNNITNPVASTDQTGEPDVTFGFTPLGRSAFQRATEQIAHRGRDVSVGSPINQHFAVALDSQLLTVPQIEWHQYPDGIIAASGADITGGFARQSARDLATELRYGALPLALRVVG
jgi:hypothetical protein